MLDENDDEVIAVAAVQNQRKRPKNKPKKTKQSDDGDPPFLEILSSYFERTEKDEIRCTVVDCNSTISRWQAYYFKRHFERRHPTLLRELFPELADIETQYQIDACNLVLSAVELVTVNGYPFAALDASGFKNIVKGQLDMLERNGYKVTLNRQMIVPKVGEMADLIRQQISKELKHKMISIMFDVCTKTTFSVLGVSTTFMENNEVIARSLGMVHLKERHTGPYIANVVEDLLKSYGVSLKQVHTVTTDLAKNMFNAARHMALHTNDESEADAYLLDIGYNSDNDIEDFVSTNTSSDESLELENAMEIANELNNDERYVQLISEMTNSLQRRSNFLSLINHINCCAHGSQLAVNEGIEKSDAKGIILEVREMVKALRTTIVNIEFRKVAPKCILPCLYNDTRWNGEYEMVKI